MSIGKKAIVFIFSLCYTLSFAHNLVPHIHTYFTETSQHEICNHQEIKADSQIFIHMNHADESLFDFLVCTFSSLKHEPDFGKISESKTAINAIVLQQNLIHWVPLLSFFNSELYAEDDLPHYYVQDSDVLPNQVEKFIQGLRAPPTV